MSEQIQAHSPSACPMLTEMVKQLRRSLRATLPSTTMRETFRQKQCSVCGLRLQMEVEIDPAYPEAAERQAESVEHIERLLKARSFTLSSTTPSTTSSDYETTGE